MKVSFTALQKKLLVLIFVLLIFSAGYKLGKREGLYSSSPSSVILNANPQNSLSSNLEKVDFSLFWKVWNILGKKYIDKSALSPQKMVYGAIAGMVGALGDPYTVFLSPDDNKEVKQDLKGNFEGIGAELGMKDKRIVVVAPLDGMPAQKAGLQAGDIILKVNSEDTSGWSLPKAVSKIRGKKGTVVVLSVLHEGDLEPVDISIVRDTIHVSSVDWKIQYADCSGKDQSCEIKKEDCDSCLSFVYLRLSRFGDSTGKEWEKAVKKIQKLECKSDNNSCRGVIFDLRNNPGGYLYGSVLIASEFLSAGTIVIQQNYDGTEKDFKVNRKGMLTKVPLVVLVNGGTASAGEIVSGALKVHKRGVIVGEKTFGKGSVQETQDFADGSGIHITVSRWLLPDRTTINGKGIEPDIKIAFDTENREKDEQLEKAVEQFLTGY